MFFLPSLVELMVVSVKQKVKQDIEIVLNIFN